MKMAARILRDMLPPHPIETYMAPETRRAGKGLHELESKNALT
jgi:hypothetical protein